MAAPYFPLRDHLTWVYAVTDPILSRIFLVRVEPQAEIEVEDLVTHEVRSERAWVLREEGREALTFAVEHEDGIQMMRERSFGKPERRAIVVIEDLRWGGDPTWSRPYWHYDLGTVRYRRAGEEEVTVTAGRFQCLKILKDDGETGAVWVAPGVGIVREVSAIEGLFPLRYAVVELHTSPSVREAAGDGSGRSTERVH